MALEFVEWISGTQLIGQFFTKKIVSHECLGCHCWKTIPKAQPLWGKKTQFTSGLPVTSRPHFIIQHEDSFYPVTGNPLSWSKVKWNKANYLADSSEISLVTRYILHAIGVKKLLQSKFKDSLLQFHAVSPQMIWQHWGIMREYYKESL